MVAVAALGQSALLDAARYEIQSDVERTVIDVFQRYVVPVVVGTGLLSIFAFAMSLASYRRTLTANRSRSRRARLRARGRRSPS